jgi:hypothetical protein
MTIRTFFINRDSQQTDEMTRLELFSSLKADTNARRVTLQQKQVKDTHDLFPFAP